MSLSRYLAPAVLAASLGAAAIAAPAPAQAQSSDDMVRVLVSVADVVLNNGVPYYRYGNYGYNDRLVMQRDRYGRPVYYRYVPRSSYYRDGPPYGNAYGYYRNRGYPVTGPQRMKCDRHGKCVVVYYDQRYDRDGRYGYDRYDRRYDDRRGDRRWHDRDDD